MGETTDRAPTGAAVSEGGTTDGEVARLRAQVANLERLGGRLAHELSTPLTTAHGFATVLLGREDLDEEVRDCLERIVSATASANAMLRSRVEEGLGDEPRALRVQRLVRDAVGAHCAPGTDAGADIPPELLVFGDPTGLRAALDLLLVVLRDRALADGADPDSVTVTAEARGSEVAVHLGVAAPALTTEEQLEVEGHRPLDGALGSLRRARALVSAIGGRLWLADPATAGPDLALLLHLPTPATE